MSPDKQKSLAAMRTFARDVEREKGTSEDQIHSVPKPIKKEASEKKKGKKPEISKPKETEGKKQPKSIPPFHEINKKAIKTDIKAEPKKKKKKEKHKDKKGIEPTKRVGGGTVITDTKKPKRSFFANVQKSVVGWFTSIKKSLQPKKKNAYVVTKTERRKGVVQKATSKTGTIFSADSETVKEQIKARQRAEKHEHDEEINWSPYTETGYALLEGEVAESTDPRIEKVAVTPKTHTLPKSVIKKTEKIPELQEKVAVPEVEPLLEELAESEEEARTKVAEPEPEIVTEPEIEVEEPLVQEEIDAEETGDFEEDEEETWALENVSLNDTNTIAMLLVGAVLAIGIFSFVLFGIFDVGRNNDTDTPEVAKSLYPGTGELKQIILTERSARELVTKANLALTENQNQTAEYLFVNPNENEISNDTLLDLLRTYKDDNFADVVTNIRYVETADEKRALIVEAPTESILLGSMLNWEPTLFVDIGALLDVPNVPLNAGEFVDTQVGDLDVRELSFDGNTLLLYSVVNETSVIITDDITVLNTFIK